MAVGGLAQLGLRRLLGRENGQGRARPPSRLDAMRQHVRRDDRRRPRGAGELDEQQPDRPAAEDPDSFGGPNSAQPDGMERDSEWLEQGHVRVAQRVRHGHQAGAGPGHELAHQAVGGAVTGEGEVQAQVGVAGAALLADFARDGRVYRHPLAAARAGRDDAAALVAGHDRPGENRAPDRSLLEPVDIGAAYAHRGHSNQLFPGPGHGPRLLHHSEVMRTV